MCEKHFRKTEIRWETSAFDEQTGQHLSYRLKVSSLLPGVVPSQMPNCPDYLSGSNSSHRPSLNEILISKEQSNLSNALMQSRHDGEQQEEYDFCLTLEDVKHKVQIEKPWQVLDSDTTNNLNICIMQYSSNAGASVDKCLTIDENLMLTCYMRSVKLSSLDKFEFPLKVNSLRTIEEVRDVLTNIQTPSCTNCSDGQFFLILQLVLSLLIPLKSENFKFYRVTWFMCEQLRLMTQSVCCYSYDFLVFASVFYNTAPNAYRFLRTSGDCLLPCLNTIRKITLSKTMRPLIEQHDTFLCYVKEKFKILQPNDKTVMLLVD